jgi:hypothetical protein
MQEQTPGPGLVNGMHQEHQVVNVEQQKHFVVMALHSQEKHVMMEMKTHSMAVLRLLMDEWQFVHYLHVVMDLRSLL